jgi:hypothetical protein
MKNIIIVPESDYTGLLGTQKEHNNFKYYKIKDSASKKTFPSSPIYFSGNYFRARVLSVLLHKDGIPNGQKLQPVKIPFNV